MWIKSALVLCFVISFIGPNLAQYSSNYTYGDEDNFYEDDYYTEERALGGSCGRHEEFLRCGEAPPCQRTCANTPCRPSPGVCSSGCFCESGYARHPSNNRCVRLRFCPRNSPSFDLIDNRRCSDNEIYLDCGPSCQRTCSNRRCERQGGCNSGCFCRVGYIRSSENGRCIRETECAESRCSRNEEWMSRRDAPDCEDTCDRDCTSVWQPYDRPGREGCYCRRGFVRESPNGDCIPRSQCRGGSSSSCNLPNEVYRACGFDCEESCRDCDRNDRNGRCRNGCFCRDGYVRIGGRCVSRSQCPGNCTQRDEVWECVNPCAELCDSTNCVSPPSCVEKCACRRGFRRLPNGNCVPSQACPLNCSGGEVVRCMHPCQDYCDSSACNGVNLNRPCRNICACPVGQQRLQNGTCVSSCPLTCDIRRFEALSAGFPCEDQCDTTACSGVDLSGIRPLRCNCIAGYKRNSNGNCVPVSDCPLRCTGANEIEGYIFHRCTESCDGRACNGITLPTTRTRQCICLPGFKRNMGSGICVATCTCTDVDTNAEYGCYNECRNQCGLSQYQCLLQSTLNCVFGCYCRLGMRRIGTSLICEDMARCCTGPLEVYATDRRSCEDNCGAAPCTGSTELLGPGCYCTAGNRRRTPGAVCTAGTC